MQQLLFTPGKHPTHPEVEEEEPPKLSPTSDALVPNQPSSSPMPFTGVGQDTKNVEED
jgi:hypothetical protein